MKLEHVAINVEDPKELAQWYADTFDLTIVRASDEEPYIHFVSDQQGTMMEFYHNPAGPIPDYAAMHPVVFHIAFATDDIEGTRDQLVEAGATVVGDIVSFPNGDQLLFFRDPWHVPFQLVKRAAPM